MTFDWETAEARPEEPALPEVLSVTQLTRRVAAELAEIGAVSVEGEVSRVSRAASGHLYFDLKDLDAKIACTLWRSKVQSALRFELSEGLQVIVRGRLDVYAPRGSYSLNVQRVEQAGLGALLQRFEELKRELKERGWFERARPLPALPRTIGVVTSRDGAAFQDFLRTRSLRWPLYPVRLAHTPVQGPGAAREIAAALQRLDASGVDVIVLCRGGGSLEDLWCFNELPVAEAIRACSVPVVSGVGHEVDVTLADLMADLRAHTPTDAAQTVIPDRRAHLEALERAHRHLARAVDGVIEERESRLERLLRTRRLRDPRWIVGERLARLDGLSRRLMGAGRERLLGAPERRLGALALRLERRSPRRFVEERRARLERALLRLRSPTTAGLVGREQRLGHLASQLEALSPVKILGRGYSITTDGAGRVVKDAAALSVGDELRTRLASGELRSRVEETLEEAAD